MFIVGWGYFFFLLFFDVILQDLQSSSLGCIGKAKDFHAVGVWEDEKVDRNLGLYW